METSYKYRLYPNKTQEKAIDSIYEGYAKCYNMFLELSYKCKKTHGYHMSRKAMLTKLFYLRGSTKDGFLPYVDILTLRHAIYTIHSKLKLYDGVSRTTKIEDLNPYASFYSYSTINETGFINIKNGKIRLPKIGYVKIRGDIKNPENSELRTITIKKNKNNEFYVSVLYEFPTKTKPLNLKRTIGLDYSIKSFYVDSNGKSPDFPFKEIRHLERKRERLRKSKKLMKIGSNNHKECLLKMRKISAKIHNVISINHIRIANELVNKYDYIAVETLDLKEMSSRKVKKDGKMTNNGRSMRRVSYYGFIKTLKHKAELNGKKVIEIPRFYKSSRICSKCGNIHEFMKDLSNKTFECELCGLNLSRDHNAAKNIKKKAIEMVKANNK